MNESFSLEFTRAGRRLKINRFTMRESTAWPVGITLDDEWSAWPRGIAFNLVPKNNVTRERMKTVQRRHGWHTGEFDLLITNNGSRLHLTGVEPNALPPGNYDFSVLLGAYKVNNTKHRLKIRTGETPVIAVDEAPPKKTLVRTTAVAQFHPGLRRIIRHRNSLLDTQPAARWIDNSDIRTRRQACLLNVFSKLAVLPTLSDPLADHISFVSFADVDRIYFGGQPTLLERLKRSTKFSRDKIVHSTHERLRRRIFNSRRNDYTLHSYREKSHPSMQIVVAEPPPDFKNRTHYADVDLDLGHPTLDVRGFIIHIGELLHPDKTDHLNLWPKLAKGPTKDHLYYKVT